MVYRPNIVANKAKLKKKFFLTETNNSIIVSPLQINLLGRLKNWWRYTVSIPVAFYGIDRNKLYTVYCAMIQCYTLQLFTVVLKSGYSDYTICNFEPYWDF